MEFNGYLWTSVIKNLVLLMALSLAGPELVGDQGNEHELMEQQSEVHMAEKEQVLSVHC